jgi:hypothetical protein
LILIAVLVILMSVYHDQVSETVSQARCHGHPIIQRI